MEEDIEGHQNKEQRSSDVCDIIFFRIPDTQHICGIFASQITKMIDQLLDLLTINFLSLGFSTIVSALICTSSLVWHERETSC